MTLTPTCNWAALKAAHPHISRKYTYVCGLSGCGADDMSRAEYLEHMRASHDRVIRSGEHALAIPR